MSNSASHIFISYAHDNAAFVQRLLHDLAAAGITTWIDETGLTPGTPNWEQAIREALHEAAGLILIATPEALASNSVQGEIALAERLDLPIYPIWARGNEWDDCVPLRMIHRQFIDLRGTRYTAGIPRLIAELLPHDGDGPPTALNEGQYLDRIMAIAPFAILIADRAGRVVRANRVAIDLLGYETLIGMDIKAIYADPNTAHDVGNRLRDSEVGELFDYSTTILGAQGEPIRVTLSASWLYDAAGQGIGSAGIFTPLDT